MKILLVEDDFLQEDAIKEAITSAFPESQIDVIWTESMFRERIDSIVENPPDLIILDGMIRWTDPSEDADENSVPSEVKQDGPYKAGARCQRILAEKALNIPIFFYTILEPSDIDLPKGVCYLRKKDDAEQLIEKIRTVLKMK